MQMHANTMINVHGYHIKDLLYESSQSRIYRGRRIVDDLPVVLKLLKSEAPTAEQRARFQQEFELTRRLPASAVITAYGLEIHEGRPVMIVEDFGGSSLKQLQIAGKLELAEWLR